MEEKGSVCVTGGTGFLASMVIKRLLMEGYSVNTTIRSGPGKSKRDMSFLTDLPHASQKLQIFNADLNNPESFNPAIEGCIGVFHIANGIDYHVESEPEEVVNKRVIGVALSILKASLNSKTVKRFIYTASCYVIHYSGKEVDEADESYQTDVDFLYKTKPPGWSIVISETLAEKAVLEFGEQHGLNVVTMILPLVVGPFVCPKLPISLHVVLPWLFGNYEYGVVQDSPMVHVEDMARAYIFLLEHPNPKGRYICSLRTVTFEEITELVRAKYPEFQIPTLDSLKDIETEKVPGLTSKKLIHEGFEFKHGIENMFDEAIQCCKKKGYL